MFRLALIILILAALVVFALQNVAPVLPLVFLGMQTQALPLAVWVVGAIAAGVLTTGLLAVLIRLAGARNGSRARRPKPRRPSSRSSNAAAGGTPWTPPPWAGDRNSVSTAQPTDASRRYGKKTSSTADEWEDPRQASEEWDNWEDDRPTPRRTAPSSRTVIQDASYTDVTEPSNPSDQPPFYAEPADSRGYRSPRYSEPDSQDSYQNEMQDGFRAEYRPPGFERDREEWDDWEEEPEQPATAASRSPDPTVEPEPEPPRTIVEIKREPQSGYQTGSVFSYTYRQSEPLSGESVQSETPNLEPDTVEHQDDRAGSQPAEPTAEPASSVYDAEFRVIIPPYRTEPDPPPAPAAAAIEPEFLDVTADSDLTPRYPDVGEPNISNSDRSDDWDEPDADEFSLDPQRRQQPQREPSGSKQITSDPMEREVWDDWDDDGDNDDPPPPSTSPEGNPPLRLG